MTNLITYKGTIHFDPVNKTKKHKNQADWKRLALVLFDGEICEYYSWFLLKRYNLKLNKPLRGAHVSFINDSISDIKKGSGLILDRDVESLWEMVKNKWDNKSIEITFDVDARSNAEHFWLNIPNDKRDELHAIRAELGLGRPFFGLHLTVGIVKTTDKEHAEYIQSLLTNGLI